MKYAPANEADLSFEMGGPAYRFMQRVGLIQGAGPSIGRRFIGFLLITWVPLLVLALIEGHALGPTPRESLLLDFATYARFFLAVPLLFVAEVVVGPRLKAAGMHLVNADLVRAADLPAFEEAVARARQRCEAWLPELIMLGAALFGAWHLSLDPTSARTWSTIGADGSSVSMAGLWYRFVAVPILQFFMLRWVWRVIIWTLLLRAVSRMHLNLVTSHPDRAAGLGFLGTAHVSIAIFPFALSCVLSGHVAFQVYFEGTPIESYQTLFLIYLVAMELFCLGPQLVFVPLLSRTRREGLRRYGILAGTYNRAFEAKWMAGHPPQDEPLLGSGDIQSLADLGNSYAVVREMKIFPFNTQQILQIAVITALPGLPLIFLVIPLKELLALMAGAIF